MCACIRIGLAHKNNVPVFDPCPIDYINWQRGLPIEDAFFTPDPRMELETLDYATYARRTATEGAVGPVPVLYGQLLSVQEE